MTVVLIWFGLFAVAALVLLTAWALCRINEPPDPQDFLETTSDPMQEMDAREAEAIIGGQQPREWN